jgi:hypothetical protein
MDNKTIEIRVEFCGCGVKGETAIVVEQDALRSNDEVIQSAVLKWLNANLDAAHAHYIDKLEAHFDRLASSA